MRMLVVGAGSTGGYFGGRLLEAGRDVTFLVRQQRKARLQADGLRIVSPFGDATLHPPLVTAKEIDGPFDVVLLTVKAYSLDEALADFAPAVGDGTMILPVLNGMRHMDRLTERFGDDAVVEVVARAVQRRMLLTDTQPEVGARAFLQHEGKVLACHARRHLGMDAPCSQDRPRTGSGSALHGSA